MRPPEAQAARLGEEALRRVQALERDLGTCVMAVQPKYRWSDLTPEQLQRLQAREKELGVILLAYDCC